MAEKLCELRKKGGGGGKYTETSLWTNPSPTSEFSGGNVTLSDSLSNYKYIKIKTRVSTTIATTWSTIYLVDDFKTFAQNSTPSGCGHIASMNTSNTRRSRGVVYVNDTTVNYKVVYEDGTPTQNNTNTIPVEILGLNELDHGTIQTASGTFTNTAGTDITVNCGFRPKKVSIYNMADANTIGAYVYDSNMSTTYTIVAYRTSSSSNACSRYTIGQSINGAFQSISDTGFTFKGIGVNVSTLYYVAIGES
jgi:hypothetical protein